MTPYGQGAIEQLCIPLSAPGRTSMQSRPLFAVKTSLYLEIKPSLMQVSQLQAMSKAPPAPCSTERDASFLRGKRQCQARLVVHSPGRNRVYKRAMLCSSQRKLQPALLLLFVREMESVFQQAAWFTGLLAGRSEGCFWLWHSVAAWPWVNHINSPPASVSPLAK